MEKLISRFQIKGDIVSINKFGNGHINKTFIVKTSEETYIFQYINENVFNNVSMLMNNINIVTNHLKKKGINTLDIIKTIDGRLYLRSGDDYFRGYKFIENSICYEKLPDMKMVYKVAQAFGQFHRGLADIDMGDIGEVIPDFHNSKFRYETFKNIVKINPKNRLDFCREEAYFLLSKENDFGVITEALRNGEIRNSITHNDPKINNVAFDKTTNEVSCVLDLDTVMSGTFLYDFGDALRSLFTGDNEDTFDLSKLTVDFDIYRNYLDGYASMMADAMNEKEIELLPQSILTITLELAVRFLGDFLNGDIYFNIDYPTHNYTRAKTQIALAKDIIKNMDELKKITQEIVSKYLNND